MKANRHRKVSANVEVKQEKLEKSLSRSRDKIAEPQVPVKISDHFSEVCEK